MDQIYQAVKGFLKSVVNLFVAAIGLLAGIIDGIAFIMEKIKPRASRRFNEIGEKGFEGRSFGWDRKVFSGKEQAGGEAAVESIRSELREKVTSREKYYCLYAKVQEDGNWLYMIVAAVLSLTLFVSIMLCTINSSREVRMIAIVFMTAVCALACMAVMKYKKRLTRNRMMKLILEEEFREIEWHKIHPITEMPREENTSEKKELAK